MTIMTRVVSDMLDAGTGSLGLAEFEGMQTTSASAESSINFDDSIVDGPLSDPKNCDNEMGEFDSHTTPVFFHHI